jgi:hypothetical protein
MPLVFHAKKSVQLRVRNCTHFLCEKRPCSASLPARGLFSGHPCPLPKIIFRFTPAAKVSRCLCRPLAALALPLPRHHSHPGGLKPAASAYGSAPSRPSQRGVPQRSSGVPHGSGGVPHRTSGVPPGTGGVPPPFQSQLPRESRRGPPSAGHAAASPGWAGFASPVVPAGQPRAASPPRGLVTHPPVPTGHAAGPIPQWPAGDIRRGGPISSRVQPRADPARPGTSPAGPRAEAACAGESRLDAAEVHRAMRIARCSHAA